ncbi:RNA dependent RNA polymerase-domain-containing protein [Peziza echinospora]|nr:RNA dependent RNA polymerase-domain-containing protein [Peziza echinospora]
MEIFMTRLPPSCSDIQAKAFLKGPLNELGILAYDVNIFRSGGKGTLTVPTIELGNALLERYGGRPDRRRQPGRALTFFGTTLGLSLSNRPPDRHAIKALYEQQARLLVQARTHQPRGEAPRVTKFNLEGMDCGLWDVRENDTPIFSSLYSEVRRGVLSFGRDGARIRLKNSLRHSGIALPGSGPEETRDWDAMIFIPFADVIALTVSAYGTPNITFTLRATPRIYQSNKKQDTDDYLVLMLQSLSMAPKRDEPSLIRISSLDPIHATIAPFCFVYRFTLDTRATLRAVQNCSQHKGVPTIDALISTYSSNRDTFINAFQMVLNTTGSFEFRVAFQLTALVANGKLPPQAIIRLLPRVSQLVYSYDSDVTASILADFVLAIEAPNPTVADGRLSHESLITLMNEIATNTTRTQKQRQGLQSARENDGKMAAIHHAFITPAGCYFEGPKPETLNRVLRLYPQFHDHFLRVTFGEENGDSVTYERGVSHKFVYDRFKEYMFPNVDGDGGRIFIGGRVFSFLGFSGASLRSHTCWFMAPFEFEGEYVDAPALIARLGDFSHIRSPGKCAARIGQAFSNTFNSVLVPQQSERRIPDIERNGRCFSDGCGTISPQMVQRIWKEAPTMAQQMPTVFQIRFAGAKGVVSLDNRLIGDVLNLRPSMVKFEGSMSRNIEICSSAHKPLPMYLNRPLIKILEDLGVGDGVFLQLQADEVKKLRDAAHTPTLAANFMQRRNIAVGQMKLPWLIQVLQNLGLSFKDDEFLGQAFELALLTALRDIKYRSRIEVPEGFTVMGLMDETGYLKEGEIYCHVESEEQNSVLTGEIVITRAPAMHPGDVQICKAVHVPNDSPLQALKNCVVFSQHGARDLPSMLSGGDLDGDLYNLIFDIRFRPQRICDGAEYPRVVGMDLGRPIVTEDMVDFLIDFMQNDRLGLISTRHLIIADQQQEGVFHRDCIQLSQMHSTAVDFPKTGIKVELSQLPKCSRVRPDFMAPGPHINIDNTIHMAPELPPEEDENDDEAENTPLRYYQSPKILGKLYRGIDERGFFEQIQPEAGQELNLLHDVWDYIIDFITDEENPMDIPWNDPGHTSFGRDMRLSYEDAVRRMMREYSLTPWAQPLREIEVFIGCIVGKGKQNRREKDNSAALKEDFERTLAYTCEMIRGNHEDSELPTGSHDILARGIACMAASGDETISRRLGEERLKSFAWVAASVTLQEVDKIQKRRRANQRRRDRRGNARAN